MIMNRFDIRTSVRTAAASLLAGVAMLCAQPAEAQYYEIANQLPSLISPALSGSFNYKGFVDASGIAGVGNDKANFISLSTTQGFQYASWFFMGAGLGVDVVMAPDPNNYTGANPPDWYGHSASKTMAMIPVFSDFRFNIGNPGGVTAFIDLKLGATWLIGNDYLALPNGRLTGGTQFYFKPSIGIRVPINSANSKQAVNFGLSYQLVTSNNYYSYWNNNSVTLNGIGATIGFEW